MNDLEKRIYDILVEGLDLDEEELAGIDENSYLFASDTKRHQDAGEDVGASFNLDSIDALELVLLIEKEWQLPQIPASEMSRFTTIKAIEEYILEHKK